MKRQNTFLVAASCLLTGVMICGNGWAADAKTKPPKKRDLPAEVSQLATNLNAVSNKVESVVIGVNGVSNKVEAVANDAADIKGRLNGLEGRVQQLEVIKAKPALKMEISRVKAVMEDATFQLEKYGSIHVSTPLLTSPTNDFLFNLRRGATNYFEEAKTNRQGGASFFEQTVQSFAARAAGQFDPVAAASYTAELGKYYSELNRFQKKQSLGDEASQAQLLADLTAAGTNMQAVAQAQQAYATRFQAASNSPAFPTTQSGNLGSMFTNELARPEVTNVFAQPKFADFQGLLTQQQVKPVLDNRSAIIQAAGDNAVESIFYLLGNPKQADQFKNQRVFFGLVTVGVDPGWRTKKGFAAEVVVATEVSYRSARAETVRRFLETAHEEKLLPKDLISAILKQNNLNVESISTNISKVLAMVRASDASATSMNLATKLQLYNAALTNKIARQAPQHEFESSPDEPEGEVVPWWPSFRTVTTPWIVEGENSPLSNNDKELLLAAGNSKAVTDGILDESIPPIFKKNGKAAVNIQVLSPLADSQTLDLASSLRRQTEIALSLSVIMRMTGGKAEAEAFEKFAKSRQFDIRTVNQLTSVNAFSSDGAFGFQIGPRMQAIGGAKKNNGAESLIERQSFPALLVLGLNNVDFQVKLEVKEGKVRILEPVIELTQTRRWQPLDRKGVIGKDWYNPLNWFHPRLREDQRMDMAEKLQAASDGLPQDADANMFQTVMRKRIEHLQAQMLGGSSVVYFDPDHLVRVKDKTEVKLAEIEKVLPEKLTFTEGQDNAFNLIFFGKNLKTVSSTAGDSVVVAGNSTISKITLVGDALVVEGKLNDAKISTLMLKFKADSGAGEYNILSRPVTVVADKKNNEGGAGGDDPKGASSLSLKSMVNAKEGLTNVLSVTISKDIPEAHLKAASEIIKTELEKGKTGATSGPNVNVSVQASGNSLSGQKQ